LTHERVVGDELTNLVGDNWQLPKANTLTIAAMLSGESAWPPRDDLVRLNNSGTDSGASAARDRSWPRA